MWYSIMGVMWVQYLVVVGRYHVLKLSMAEVFLSLPLDRCVFRYWDLIYIGYFP